MGTVPGVVRTVPQEVPQEIRTVPRVARRFYNEDESAMWLEVYIRPVVNRYNAPMIYIISIILDEQIFGPLELRTTAIWERSEVAFDTLSTIEQELVWEAILSSPD